MFRFNRILVPTDLTAESRTVVESACGLAVEMSAEILMLHVMTPAAVLPPLMRMTTSRVESDDRGRIQRQLDELPADSAARERVVVRGICEGEPATTIVEYARKHDVGLIVMGAMEHRSMRPLRRGTVIQTVVQQAACPVLTLPSSD